jgi:hypothetical protein
VAFNSGDAGNAACYNFEHMNRKPIVGLMALALIAIVLGG